MKPFVKEDSIVREIWGKSDTILFIFAGASAEFALNKAVDWLYFTGKLPSDPIGRLFTTVSYARKIVFSPESDAFRAIDSLRKIHSNVENARGFSIPDWAYRDVLFMLIHYSIAAYELLEKKLKLVEKQEIFDVFYRLGDRMGLKELPASYDEWQIARKQHMMNDLERSSYSTDLFNQYKKHLGIMRFRVLIEAQKLLVPSIVKELLHFSSFSFLTPVIPLYKITRFLKLDWLLKKILLPGAYKTQIEALNVMPKQKQLHCPFGFKTQLVS